MPFDATVVAGAAVFCTLFFDVAHFPTTLAGRLVHLALAAASVCSVSRSAARLAHSSVRAIWALTCMVIGRIASAASVPLASFAPWCSLPPFPLPFRASPSFPLHAFPTPTSPFSPSPFSGCPSACRRSGSSAAIAASRSYADGERRVSGRLAASEVQARQHQVSPLQLLHVPVVGTCVGCDARTLPGGEESSLGRRRCLSSPTQLAKPRRLFSLFW